MSFETLIKRLENIMRADDLSGKVQYLRQIVWMVFLKIYDAKEYEWEFTENYTSIIPDKLKWREWAQDNADGKALTGGDLIDFVNNILIKTLKELPIDENTPKKHRIVKYIFEDAANYMKDGTKLRQMINAFNEVDFTDYKESHEFGDMYESMLKDLQDSKRDGGEFYTPRALTDFIVDMVSPEIGQKIGDFACGTGGFLISSQKYLEKKYAHTNNPEDRKIINNNLIGIEKKSFPYSLGLTNLILHDVDEPNILYYNSLKDNVREFDESQLVDIIVMNPPYGGSEDDIVKTNFPPEHRSSETADLFMSLIMHKLRLNGKCGVVLPDGFLFGDDNAKANIKKQLLDEFDLHTIIRLPKSVFAPYTSITTNVLFFTKNGTGTEKTWFYRMDLPEGYKAFSKTKPINRKHFEVVSEWWNNRIEMADEDGNYKAKAYTKAELCALGCSFDLCGFPNKMDIDKIIYSNDFQPAEVSNICKNVITAFTKNNEIDIETSFWNLGELKKKKQIFNLPFGGGISFEGTQIEEERYHLILNIYQQIQKYNEYLNYFEALDSKKHIKCAVSNIGTTFDEDVDVKLKIEEKYFCEHSCIPVPGENIIKDVNSNGILKLIFNVPKDEKINPFTQMASSITAIYNDLDRMNPFNTRSSDEEYKIEMTKYKDGISNIFDYEIFRANGYVAVSFNLKYIKHNSNVAFPSILMFNEVPPSISYEISSQHVAEVVSGTINFDIEKTAE